MSISDEYIDVSTHSRPKAAVQAADAVDCGVWFQHTAARRRLLNAGLIQQVGNMFQHTAARRRLAYGQAVIVTQDCFNTQPPEGG